jgi:hypothetical protein
LRNFSKVSDGGNMPGFHTSSLSANNMLERWHC